MNLNEPTEPDLPQDKMFDATTLLQDIYQSVGIGEDQLVYLTGNIGGVGLLGLPTKEKVLEAHLCTLIKLLGPQGTLVMPSFSWRLLRGPSPVFDPARTPSETGVLSEYLRVQPGTMRSRHPLASVVATGKLAEAIATAPSRHAYGPLSPWDVMVQSEGVFVSIGLPLERTISLVHHVEHIMAVPYRFVKEFRVGVVQDQTGIVHESYWLKVLDRETEIRRDKNKRIVKAMRDRKLVTHRTHGTVQIESISMRDFVEVASRIIAENPFAWLAERPQTLPFERFL